MLVRRVYRRRACARGTKQPMSAQAVLRVLGGLGADLSSGEVIGTRDTTPSLAHQAPFPAKLSTAAADAAAAAPASKFSRACVCAAAGKEGGRFWLELE
jgi:hypothetical protein